MGIWHETRSQALVIICHEFRSSKDRIPMVNLAFAFGREGIGAFRFDFTGNGESSFQYGNYIREAEDLRSVIKHFHAEKRSFMAVIGHRKGEIEYRVNKESLMDRLKTSILAACRTIPLSCRVLTIHGSEYEIDAIEFSMNIKNHTLHKVEGADHEFSKHQVELGSIIVDFVKKKSKPEPTLHCLAAEVVNLRALVSSLLMHQIHICRYNCNT